MHQTEGNLGCAYVTFMAGDGDYVKGVMRLAKGLRKAESKYPLVVAVLPYVLYEHRKILTSQGCIVREIEPFYPPENQTKLAMAYYVINYSKLRIWEFIEYSKMIYLDSDIQVFENIDHLFDLPNNHFSNFKEPTCSIICRNCKLYLSESSFYTAKFEHGTNPFRLIPQQHN